MEGLLERNPYIHARQLFLDGRIMISQAVAMVASDRDFIAETELQGRKPLEEARAIVRGPWSLALVQAIRDSKRAATPPTATPQAPCGLFAALDDRPSRAFCGPTAIAALTGLSVVEVENAVIAYRAKNPTPRREALRGARVKSMWGHECEGVLALLGWRVAHEFFGNPTFARWRRGVDKSAAFLVLVTGHFVAVRGGQFADTRHREPIALDGAPYARKRVVRAYRIEPIAQA